MLYLKLNGRALYTVVLGSAVALTLRVFVDIFQAGGPDYYIEGILNRNRAFNDDVVVINVLPPDQWKVCGLLECHNYCSVLLIGQLITQAVDDGDDNNGDKGTDDKSSAINAASLPPQHSDGKDDTNNVSKVTQETVTLDSVPTMAGDLVKDKVTAESSTGDTNSNANTEVCYYYDTSQYDKVLRETFRAVNSDVTDGDVSNDVVTAPDLEQIINGHPLRMYKRTAKVQ